MTQRRLCKPFGCLLVARRCVAAVEFALLAPVFVLMFAGIVDLGNALWTWCRLEEAVAAGTGFALVNGGVNASDVNSVNGQNLASDIAGIVANSAIIGSHTTPASVTVVVNNGPATTITNGVSSNSGTASAADSYYCLTGSPPAWTWGSAVASGIACTGGDDIRKVRHRHRELQLHALLRQLRLRDEWCDDGRGSGPNQVIRMLSQLHRARKAVAALEFALLAIPLLLLLLGTLEFGRLMWFREALQMTANEGARCMGVVAASCASSGVYDGPTTTTYIENVANNWGITLVGANVTLARPSTNSNCLPTLTTPLTPMSEVTITYTFQTAIPQLLNMLVGKSLTAHACFPNSS